MATIPEVARHDVPLAILTNKMLSVKDEWTRQKLERELQQEGAPICIAYVHGDIVAIISYTHKYYTHAYKSTCVSA